MRFDWDPAKDESNRKKHLVSFETAQLVFNDPHCITFVERIENGEQRWHAIGAVMGAVVLTVAHTYGTEGAEEIIRIVSARRATSHERKLYVQAL